MGVSNEIIFIQSYLKKDESLSGAEDNFVDGAVLAAARTLPTWSDGDLPPIPSIERKAAKELQEECLKLLAEYPTTADEDQRILDSDPQMRRTLTAAIKYIAPFPSVPSASQVVYRKGHTGIRTLSRQNTILIIRELIEECQSCPKLQITWRCPAMAVYMDKLSRLYQYVEEQVVSRKTRARKGDWLK
ncbi:hypothetical protein QJS04_geneDACA022733 [Acorus gramineus]|uniref:Rubisco LSMT substrate-binding domain-containing protein n=1 Tax=Acorus gramineus TaxID=55184 RepID=A0AAV9BNZ9_ACOGR|nr:hypothetical protein QJS04_geneDACA022733 [Acorus gramineus]